MARRFDHQFPLIENTIDSKSKRHRFDQHFCLINGNSLIEKKLIKIHRCDVNVGRQTDGGEKGGKQPEAARTGSILSRYLLRSLLLPINLEPFQGHHLRDESGSGHRRNQHAGLC